MAKCPKLDKIWPNQILIQPRPYWIICPWLKMSTILFCFICILQFSNALLVYYYEEIFLLKDQKSLSSPIFPHLFLAEDHPPGTVESHHLDRLSVSRHDTCRECLAAAVCQLCTGPEVGIPCNTTVKEYLQVRLEVVNY